VATQSPKLRVLICGAVLQSFFDLPGSEIPTIWEANQQMLRTMGVKVVVIVHTETEEEIRVISMREADNNEQLLFFTNL
jgi:hypothetical protein